MEKELFGKLKKIAKEEFDCDIIETPPNGESFETIYSIRPEENCQFVLNKYPKMWGTSSAIDIVDYIDNYIDMNNLAPDVSFIEAWKQIRPKFIDLIEEAKIIENDE